MARMLPGDYENDAVENGAELKADAADKTWNLNPNGEGERYLDGLAALRQSVSLALATPRYAHLIYSFDYGSELLNLFGYSNDLVQTEAVRLIREALLVDERILAVDNFRFDFAGDAVQIAFDVRSKLGDFAAEVSL